MDWILLKSCPFKRRVTREVFLKCDQTACDYTYDLQPSRISYQEILQLVTQKT